MKQIKYIMVAALCIMGMTACQDDYLADLAKGADETRPIKTSLSFGVPRASEVTVTKADNSNSDLFSSGIRIYVFNTDGSFLSTQDFTSNDLTDDGLNESTEGRRYTAQDVTLYVGTQRVYALANFSQSGYFNNVQSLLNALQTAAERGEENFLKQYYDLASETSADHAFPSFTTGAMPLSGVGTITVTANGITDDKVELKRLVAQICFKINTIETRFDEEGTEYDITFTPQTYTFYNLPKKGFVLENEGTAVSTEAADFYNSYTGDIDPASEQTQQTSFEEFVPENIQKMQQSCGNDYDKRDAFTEQNGEVKTWSYAPQQGMYVVIRGRYEEKNKRTGALNKSGDVEYTIHLGDFSKTGSKDDYQVKRNTIYTYTVTVEGVEKIIVEAERENLGNEQNGAEGDIIELDDASQVFNLDAHYEQVYVDYNLSDVVDQLRSQGELTDTRVKELIAGNFILSFRSPLNTESNKVVKPYYNVVNDQVVDNEAEAMSGIDYKWVEFFPQRDANAISKYPGVGNSQLLSAWTVCKEMGEAVYALYHDETPNPDHIILSRTGYNSGDYVARFTAFVNEYVYQTDLKGQTVGWDSYANQEARVMMIASDMKISTDNNSTYSTARTYISQAAIQTFYYQNRDNAMGIEVYNENGLIEGAGSPVQTGTDWVNGRENTIYNISGQGTLSDYDNVEWSGYGSGRNRRTYIDWTKIGYKSDNSLSGNEPGYYNLSSAYYACLSRNRDLDGDGDIDDDELRWYLPALSQYMRIGIGTMALSADARLFQGSKSDMTKTGYDNGSYANRGTFYFMSDAGHNFYWAVEVGAYGTTKGNKAHVRCVRNLPGIELVEKANQRKENAPVGDEALGEPIYQEVKYITVDGSRNYLFDFGDRLAPAIFRNSSQPQEGPYESHDEEDAANRLPNAFVLAKKYIPASYGRGDQLYNSLSVVHDRSKDPCRNYSETDADKGYWRTPNLSELMILTQAENTHRNNWGSELNLLKSEGNTYCSTKFSNSSVRGGFIYQPSNRIVTAPDTESSTGYIRCVRDATQEERNAARAID